MAGIKIHARRSNQLRKSEGMTLVELLVAIGVTSIVATLSIAIFVSQLSHYERGKSVKQTQEAGQGTIELLKSEIMQAGWSVLPDMAFFIQDGGGTGTDRLYLNDTRIIDLNVPSERRLMLLNDCPGGQPIRGGNNSSSPRVENADIDFDGANDFKDNITEYVISDSTDILRKVARITGVSGTQLSLDGTLGGTYLAPAVFYCVDDGDELCHPEGSEQNILRRSDRTLPGRTAIADNVVDMQIAYQVGSTWYGEAGCTATCNFSPFDSKQIKLVRVSIVSKGKALQPERINDPLYCQPSLENHVVPPGTECGHVYRTYTATIQPRNSGPQYR